MLKPNYDEWIGRTQVEEGRLDRSAVAMLHATVGMPGEVCPTPGDAMPPLWHWCAFNPTAPMDQLDRDGHPTRGDFLPPINLERRMWASGGLSFLAPVHLGETLTRRSRIADVAEKSSAASEMVFVTLEHEIATEAGVVIRETQNIVYLPLPEEFAAPAKRPVFEDAAFTRDVEAREAMLFRYSAATFNAHRIHYDLNYASEVEKYPGLVVHGPLQATLLMGEAMRQTGRRPASFTFRGVHPMFHNDDLCLFGRHVDGATEMCTEMCTGLRGGHQGVNAKILWEDDQ